MYPDETGGAGETMRYGGTGLQILGGCSGLITSRLLILEYYTVSFAFVCIAWAKQCV